jgi:hypothetical protein
LVHSITGHNFETRHPSDDSDQVLVSIGPVVSEEKIFEKVYDGRRRRTPSDGNSSPGPWDRWAKTGIYHNHKTTYMTCQISCVVFLNTL